MTKTPLANHNWPGPTPASLGLTLASWPPGSGSLVLGLLAEGLGLSLTATAGELVEFEDFPVSVTSRFDAAVAEGSVADTAADFRQFASTDFSAFDTFRTRWASLAPGRLVVPVGRLRADPGLLLPMILSMLVPARAEDLQKDAAAADLLARRAETWLAAHRTADPEGFRHHDPALFARLGRLNLRREDVADTFHKVMGRMANPDNILDMQTFAHTAALQDSLMSSLEYRRREALAAGDAPMAALLAESAEVLPDPLEPQPFTGFARIFDRSEKAMRRQVLTPEATAKLLPQVRHAALAVETAQQTYQPLHGMGQAGASAREGLLREGVEIVKREFIGVARKNQLRILDVGCNAGFVTFALAETFPNSAGFDVNSDNIALCRALKAHSGSSAMFFETDVMEVADDPEAGFESLDCILFLNVIHQLIFARGVPYVKALLARLSRSVDFIVVELATRADYVPYGKDQLLPLDPAEILEDCTDATITLVKTGKRPVYTIRRRRLTVGDKAVDYSECRFSEHPQGRVNRKYYFGSDTLTKVIRYTASQFETKFAAELTGLKALDGLDVAPRLVSWDSDARMGRICMERLYGQSLLAALPGLQTRGKADLLREIVRISAAMATRGLCQNDFSSHNLILQSDGTLRMIDFEQAGPVFLRDPFASFLWLAHDIAVGEPQSYRKVDPVRLGLPKDDDGAPSAPRVGQECYPGPDDERMRSIFGRDLARIVHEAADTVTGWNDFIGDAWARLRKAHR